MKSIALLPILGLAIQTTHARLHESGGLPIQDRVLISCSSDADCASESEFCAGGVCRPFGTCGTVEDCMNPSNEQFLPQCMGYRICEGGSCGMMCSESACSSEDDMAETQDCPSRPCDVVQCDETYESCVDDYCGGCNALFFDATGRLVCTVSEQEESAACDIDYDTCRNEGSMVGRMMCIVKMTRQALSCALQP